MTHDDPADRLLREALEAEGGYTTEITSMDELYALVHAAGFQGSVTPTREDMTAVPQLPLGASDAELAHAYQLAQAHALLRIARAEKARR